MKKLVNTLFLALPLMANAQVFHFNYSSTTIIKDITQSPAHWYLEIYNDQNVDDTLRWKAHFVNIPPQWEINYDVQSGYWNPVLDGDSADFLLMDSLDFPQKLIIGNATNLTPGQGSIFMDIYDPENPTDLVTIEYEYIITLVGAGMENELSMNAMLITKDYIQFNFAAPGEYYVCTIGGQLITKGTTPGSCDLSTLSPGIYFVHVQVGEKKLVRKFTR